MEVSLPWKRTDLTIRPSPVDDRRDSGNPRSRPSGDPDTANVGRRTKDSVVEVRTPTNTCFRKI